LPRIPWPGGNPGRPSGVGGISRVRGSRTAHVDSVTPGEGERRVGLEAGLRNKNEMDQETPGSTFAGPLKLEMTSDTPVQTGENKIMTEVL